jgi:large conductance mechanosensitive channel
MGMISEFKDFAVKGNMLDMAVGIIIGGAFGTIISSLVGDVNMPVVGFFSGGLDFSQLSYTLGAGADGEPVAVKYGLFINALIAFLIVAFVLFMIIKAVNKAKEAAGQADADAETPRQEVLLEEIRDALKR